MDSKGFGILEVMISAVLILLAVAACFTAVKVQSILDPSEDASAAGQLQRRQSMLYAHSNFSTQDTDGDVWDLDTVQPDTVVTINGIEYTTTHTVTQAPGGRDYRIARATTTWTQRNV